MFQYHTLIYWQKWVCWGLSSGAWHSSPVATEKQPLERLASRVNTGQACRPQLWETIRWNLTTLFPFYLYF